MKKVYNCKEVAPEMLAQYLHLTYIAISYRNTLYILPGVSYSDALWWALEYNEKFPSTSVVSQLLPSVSYASPEHKQPPTLDDSKTQGSFFFPHNIVSVRDLWVFTVDGTKSNNVGKDQGVARFTVC